MRKRGGQSLSSIVASPRDCGHLRMHQLGLGFGYVKCEIVETSARGAPQSSVKLHVKRDTPPISANFMKFQQLFLIGKLCTEFLEILSLANF